MWQHSTAVNSEGEGEANSEGEGEANSEGEGQANSEGEGQATSEGECEYYEVQFMSDHESDSDNQEVPASPQPNFQLWSSQLTNLSDTESEADSQPTGTKTGMPVLDREEPVCRLPITTFPI